MRALEDAYNAAGNLVVAGATGIEKSDLPKMFEPGSNRHMRFKAVFQIGEIDGVSTELRHRILAPLAQHFGFRLCLPYSDKDRAQLLADYILAMDLGELLVARALGGLMVVDDKERADKLEAWLRREPLGDLHVERALGGRR
jgi:hypothetical protein